jgi:hypothetical protein
VDDIRTVQQQREEMHGELKWETVRGGLRSKKYKSLVNLLFALSRQQQLTGMRCA